VACDVGQGDGLVFKIDEATAMVSDVGAEPESIKACLSRLGITSVPIVLLTHFHSDHAGALDGLVGFGVESIGVTTLRRPESVAQMVGVFAERERAEVYELSAGQSFDIGDMSVRLIWPPKPIGPALNFSDAPENDASLVFMVSQEVSGGERSFTTLVTGDIEQMAQGVLARNWSWGLVDLFKVPHHGSVVQDERLPALTKAKTAVVSVGAENSFGHPHERTLDLLSQANMHVFRTDQSGDIAFSWRDDEVSVATRR
jgi:competence protein ComEC